LKESCHTEGDGDESRRRLEQTDARPTTYINAGNCVVATTENLNPACLNMADSW